MSEPSGARVADHESVWPLPRSSVPLTASPLVAPVAVHVPALAVNESLDSAKRNHFVAVAYEPGPPQKNSAVYEPSVTSPTATSVPSTVPTYVVDVPPHEAAKRRVKQRSERILMQV